MSSAIRARRLLPFLLALASACAPVSEEEDEGFEEEERTEEETPSQISSNLEDEIDFDADAEGVIAAASVPVAAAAGPGIGGSVEVTIDFNRWTDQMTGWLKKKSNSDHYHSTADMWLFFEGNHCAQNLVGSLWTPSHGKQKGSIKGKPWFVNDEARSVLINKGRKGQKLFVADNSGGKKSDDWAEVLIKKSFNGAYCVGTFEADYQDAYVKVVFHDNNGLDGKISWVSNY